MTNTAGRYLLKCKAHGTTVTTREQLEKLWDSRPGSYGYGQCRECTALGVVKSITAKQGTKACGAWCTEGTGSSCTCECNGANHGRDYADDGYLWYSR